MHISSKAFKNGEKIPKRYGYSGENINPPLDFYEIPENTKDLLLIVEDPDATAGPNPFTHWAVYNIQPDTAGIDEGALPIGASEATNDFGRPGYDGPKPPSGTHRYFFKLFALDRKIEAEPSYKRADIYQAMEGHILDTAELIGTYKA